MPRYTLMVLNSKNNFIAKSYIFKLKKYNPYLDIIHNVYKYKNKYKYIHILVFSHKNFKYKA